MAVRLVAILLLCLGWQAYAQNRTTFAGVRNAYDYAYGINPRVSALSVAVGSTTAGIHQITISVAYLVATDGTTFYPLSLQTPLRIGSGTTTETITPTTVNCLNPQVYASCSFTATFTYPHGTGDIITSGTVGLQEAINQQSLTGGTEVSIDASWALHGGTTAMIQNAVTGTVAVAAPFIMTPGVPVNPCGFISLAIDIGTAALYACTIPGGNWALASGSGGSMVWPPTPGVANYAGSSSWGNSYAVGTGANDLVQLNGSAQLPAVSAALLTNFPIFNQSTTGTAANVTGVVAEANGGTGANNTTGAAGHYLRSNGTHYVDGAIQVADVPTLNQSTTGNAATATALAATPSQCGGGTPIATGVDAGGNAHCTAAGTAAGGANAIQTSDGAGNFIANSGDTKDTSGNEVLRGSLTTGSGTSGPGTWSPLRTTVANLSASPPTFSAGSIREVSDGSTTCDTTVGGGSNTVLAQYTGSVWQPVNAACGGGTVLETIPFLLGGTNISTGTTNNFAVNYGTGVSAPSNNTDFPALIQFASTGGTVILHWALGHTWTGAIDIKVRFWQNSGGSGNIQWNAQTSCYTVGSTVTGSASYNTVSTATVAVPSGNILGEADMLSLNTSSTAACAVDDDILIKVFSTANGSGGTTYTSPVYVDKIVLVLRHT